MFGEEYYAELESVPRRWKTQLAKYWFRAAIVMSPALVAVTIGMFLGTVAKLFIITGILVYALIVQRLLSRDFSGHIGFLCGYVDCGRLVSPLFHWECPYCGHFSKLLYVDGRGSYFRNCKACGRKPFTIACPHCDRPLPLVRPEQMPSRQPHPARVFLPGKELFVAAPAPAAPAPPSPLPPQSQSASGSEDLADISRRLDH